MKRQLLLISILLITNACQKVERKTVNRGDRVAVAYQEKEELLKALFVEKGMDWKGFELFFRAFKKEEELEIWVKNGVSEKFSLLKTYPFCTNSGVLGPKRKEGDRQIPEGFYKINRFNPKSSFYLSLGLNYPNKSDLILGDKKQPGSDIFIHGACVSVGCVSITDDKIKEVYLLANEAKKQGQKAIEVHFFPFRFKNNLIEKIISNNPKLEQNRAFWESLKVGFDKFEEGKNLFDIEIDESGNYILL